MLDRYDIAALAGLTLLATGLWLIMPALAFIVVGALALAFSLVGATRAGDRKEE